MSGRRPGAYEIIVQSLDKTDPRALNTGAHDDDATAILNALWRGGFSVVERPEP